MNYEKPEVVLVTSAVRGIQGCGDKTTGQKDCDSDDSHPSAGAYEADE